MNKIKVLHIVPNFNYSCGVSKHVYLLLKNSTNFENIEFHLITNGGDSINRLSELNINYTIIKFSIGFKNIIYFLNSFLKIKKYCVINKIDIIHTHHRFPEFLAFIISKIIRIRTVTTVHSYVQNYKYLSYKSNKIITVSNFIKNNIENNFKVNKNDVTTLYNFIEPLKPFCIERVNEIRKKLDIAIDDRVLLFVGRIAIIKGADILIDIFNKLNLEKYNIKLLLIGQLQFHLQSVKNNNIKIIKPQNDIENYYYLGDIVILPSRMDPFPYTMLEAALSRKPIIASNVGGISEFIIHKENGILFNINNPNELGNFIKELLVNNEMGTKLINRNEEKVTEYLNKEKYFKNLVKLYKDLL